MSIESISPFAVPEPLLVELRAAYASPPRHYHDFGHVEEVAEHFAEVARSIGWQQPVEVFGAILFHDAIYVAGARDNEARSAALAHEAITRYLGESFYDLDRVEQLILLTARHGRLDPAELDPDAAAFVDCDMAILGAPPDRYAAYEAAIAREYAVLAPVAYRAGRSDFLRRLLERDRIFMTDHFHRRFDQAARTNLRGALGGL